MRVYAQVFARGVLQVALVACNTKQIASGHLAAACGVGFLISLVWWSNSSKARPDVAGAGATYAAGAACGTALGYFLAGLLSGK